MLLVTNFARTVSLPRPLSPPPSCTRLCLSLSLALLLTATWVAAYAWLFIRSVINQSGHSTVIVRIENLANLKKKPL